MTFIILHGYFTFFLCCMKTLLIGFTLLLCSASRAQDSTAAPHKGKIKISGLYKVELVDCYQYIEVYLYDLEMESVLNYGFSGWLDFYFADNTCSSSETYFYGADAFSAEVHRRCFTRCQVRLYRSDGIKIKVDFEGFTNEEGDCLNNRDLKPVLQIPMSENAKNLMSD